VGDEDKNRPVSDRTVRLTFLIGLAIFLAANLILAYYLR
jgi:hypothetical protein